MIKINITSEPVRPMLHKSDIFKFKKILKVRTIPHNSILRNIYNRFFND